MSMVLWWGIKNNKTSECANCSHLLINQELVFLFIFAACSGLKQINVLKFMRTFWVLKYEVSKNKVRQELQYFKWKGIKKKN